MYQEQIRLKQDYIQAAAAGLIGPSGQKADPITSSQYKLDCIELTEAIETSTAYIAQWQERAESTPSPLSRA